MAAGTWTAERVLAAPDEWVCIPDDASSSLTLGCLGSTGYGGHLSIGQPPA